MSNCLYDGGCSTPPSNQNDLLIAQLQRELKELSQTTTASLLKHDGKIAELCLYLQSNLSNTIRELLNTMMSTGELKEIITDFILSDLNQKIYHCDSLITLKDSYYKPGDVVKTLGYYEPGDGGAALYRIRCKLENEISDTSLLLVNNGLYVAEMVIENDSVNVKQYGAKGDGKTDDSEAIQTALNSASNIYLNQGEYVISKTLLMNVNTRFYGTNEKDSVLLLDSALKDSYVIKYGSEYTYNNSKAEISNMTLKSNVKNTTISKGIYLNSGIKISHVDFNRLKNAIIKNTSYIDQIVIDRCNFYYCSGTESQYVIDIRGNNDGLLINQIHMVDEYTKANYSKFRGIGISTCYGGSINNSIINVPVYIVNSKGFSINNSHFEGSQHPNFYGNLAQIEIYKSSVSLNNNFIQKCIDRANILIKGETEDVKNISNVELNNCILIYPSHYLELYNFNNLYDIEKEEFTILKVNNSYSLTDLTAVWTQTDSKIGLRIKDNKEFNKHSSYYSTNSVIDINNRVISPLPVIRENNGYYSRNIFEYSNINKYVPWFEGGFKETATYYAGVYVFDEDRKLALFKSASANELVVRPTTKGDNTGNGVMLRVSPSKIADGLGMTLFIYRGTASKKYNRLTKVPSTGAMYLYDMGTAINGIETDSRVEGDIDSFNFVKRCELVGDNVIFYADSLPTYGSFKKYDRCINTNIKTGEPRSWIYDGSNWIAEGNY